jgi:mannose-6-phosphate isomerase-like protein (cupin superfamily)
MKSPILALAIVAYAALPAVAQAPADGGVTLWVKGVPPGGITEKKDFGDHAFQIGHREENGRAEIHMTKADVMVIQSGAATLITGGEAIDKVSTGSNEFQGSGIKGGVSHNLTAGDILEIPPGVPHQFLVPKGGQVTYFVTKVVRTPKP